MEKSLIVGRSSQLKPDMIVLTVRDVSVSGSIPISSKGKQLKNQVIVIWKWRGPGDYLKDVSHQNVSPSSAQHFSVALLNQGSFVCGQGDWRVWRWGELGLWCPCWMFCMRVQGLNELKGFQQGWLVGDLGVAGHMRNRRKEKNPLLSFSCNMKT